jgi:hypothetical protein
LVVNRLKGFGLLSSLIVTVFLESTVESCRVLDLLAGTPPASAKGSLLLGMGVMSPEVSGMLAFALPFVAPAANAVLSTDVSEALEARWWFRPQVGRLSVESAIWEHIWFLKVEDMAMRLKLADWSSEMRPFSAVAVSLTVES